MKPVALFAFLCCLIPCLSKAYSPFVDNEGFFLRHLKTNRYGIDTNANAVVLYETGVYKMYRHNNGDLHYTKYIRRIIKILTDEGFSQADIAFGYPSEKNDGARVTKLDAKTYSLDGENIKITKLDNKVVSNEQANDGYKLLKFSMPAVSKGVILDFAYEVDHLYEMQFGDWSFQDDIPVLHSEFSATYMEKFGMSFAVKTNVPYKLVSFKDVAAMADSAVPNAYYSQPEAFGNSTTRRWVRRNLPAIIEEPHLYNIRNYVDGVDIYVVSSPYDATFKMGSWIDLNKTMNSDFSSFSSGLNAKQAINNLTKQIFAKASCTTALDSAKKIYRFICENFNRSNNGLYTTKLKQVVDEKKGTSADVTVLLKVMLENAGFKANAVLVGLREYGKLLPEAPVITNINYMVCRVQVDGDIYYLDPTEKFLPFGVLNPSCYNGFAWCLGSEGFGVNIAPDSLRERVAYTVVSENEDTSNYVVKISQVFGSMSGAALRKQVATDKSMIDAYVKRIVDDFPFEAELINVEVANVEDSDAPLKLSFRMKLTLPVEDKLFFSPSMFNCYNVNPFKASVRIFPIEMPYALDYYYMLKLKLPSNYTVQDLPASLKCTIDDKNNYNYISEYEAETNTLSVMTRLKMHNTFFEAVNYDPVRSFYDKILQQQQKPMVLQKRSL